MELKDYWLTVRRRWKVIVACLVVAIAAAGVLTWQATPQYSSSARLFVSTSPSDTADAYQGNLFATQRVTSYADMVGSRQLADEVNDALGADYDATELSGKVTATVVPETVILELTAQDADPEIARDIAQAYAEGLSSMVGELETPEGGDNPLIKASIVDDARVNTAVVSPNVLRNLGLAAVLGLLLGLGLAVTRELLDTSVASADDVALTTEAPVVGNIFSDTVAVRRPPAAALDDATPWAEAFRVLRTNMQYVQVDSDNKVYVVTSSLPGEGKSTTAINLAVTLAMADQKVALVECDLRRPLVGDRLGLVSSVGTTTVLVGRIGLDEALQSYEDTGLQVLTSGQIPPNPSELLQSHAMENLLADLRSRFDVVIIDAPPLLPVTDAALLSTQADGAFVVVRHGRTTRDQLSHAVDRLEAVDAKVLGVVMNQSPSKKRAGNSYGYGYGYGYGYAPTTVKKGGKKDGRRSRRPEPAPIAEPMATVGAGAGNDAAYRGKRSRR